jgi:hypothetical protein
MISDIFGLVTHSVYFVHGLFTDLGLTNSTATAVTTGVFTWAAIKGLKY